jgi:hypothetical protein
VLSKDRAGKRKVSVVPELLGSRHLTTGTSVQGNQLLARAVQWRHYSSVVKSID